MAFFKQSPKHCKRNFDSVIDVQEEIKRFKLLYEIDPKTGSVNNCGDADKAANWRRYVREAVINCAGTPVELDFFEKIWGGKTESIPTTRMTFKQNCDIDRNIVAGETKSAAGPNQPLVFRLQKSSHSVNGTSSLPVKGFEIWNYQIKHWMLVQDVNRDTPYGHLITVVPKKKGVTLSVTAGKKMLVSSAKQVGGYTCNDDYVGTHSSPGFFYDLTMGRWRVQWKHSLELNKGFKDQLVFGTMFDNEGKEIDGWEYYKKIKAMEDLKYAMNLQFFLGEKVDNPDIFVENMNGSSDLPGFNGYYNQVKNAGGIRYPYDPQYGIDPYADFASILMRQDSLKRQTEFILLNSLNFKIPFDRNFSKFVKTEPGALTYDTFKRMAGKSGSIDQAVKRIGVESLYLWNFTVHLKNFDALNDTRSIGNDDMPYIAFMMPSNNLKDSNGRDVPPLEFFQPTGFGATGIGGQFEEHEYDARNERSGCEEVGGWMSRTIGMVTHCLQDHILLEPRKRC